MTSAQPQKANTFAKLEKKRDNDFSLPDHKFIQ